ncbi:MAG: DUF72 domain-containing protein [Bacteroidota bacterium]
MSKNAYHIGCSGYYYPYWKNRFYPQGLAPKDWLAYYSSIFNTVELNGTFYRTPKLSDLQKYASKTGEQFLFSVKMSRYVTHVLKLKNARQAIEDFLGLLNEGLGDKLAHVLFQLPPSFHYTEENLQRVLNAVPNHPGSVVEFRHISWWNKEVEAALTKTCITFCNVDFPGLDSVIIHTTGRFYFRFHGNPELFKSAYSTKSLQQFAGILKDRENSFVYFNNTYYEAGYTNASQLAGMLTTGNATSIKKV